VLHRPVELAAQTGQVKCYFKWTVTRLIRMHKWGHAEGIETPSRSNGGSEQLRLVWKSDAPQQISKARL
jgi:hypothetical protein